MKKIITKEQIVNTAIGLIRNRDELRSAAINMRELARALGCAHTNIYNYFPTYSDLLWAVHTALLWKFSEILKDGLSEVSESNMKFKCFFDTLVGAYLDNKGWFRLIWMEFIDNERPQSNIDAAIQIRQALNGNISEIWQGMTGIVPADAHVDRIVHNTHCYIVGEISNCISGRELIENESELKAYIADEAMNIMALCLRKG